MSDIEYRLKAVYWKLQSKLHRFQALIHVAKLAKKISGKQYISQLYEILVLRFSRGELDPSEYYYYRLHDDVTYSLSDKKQFIGQRAGEKINDGLNDKEWRAIANDKLILYSILRGVGLPLPEIYAVYRPTFRFFSAILSLTNTDLLKVFLRNQVRYPFFAKPVVGAFGSGAVAVKAYDKTTGQITLFNEDRMSVEELVRTIDSSSATGYLLQEYLMPHPDIKKICGECLSTVRFNISLTAEGPSLFHCFWKIPTGRNMTDNFSSGETGNLLGCVNLETGLVEGVTGGSGFEITGYHNHPDTGEPLLGITLPYWEEMKSLCLNAATMLPGLRLQHWDVALSERGPVLMEVNSFGVFSGHQIAYRSGIYKVLQEYLSLYNDK